MPRSGARAIARLFLGAAPAVAAWVGCSSDPAPATTAVVADASSGPVRIPQQPDPGFDSGPSCQDDCIARHPVGAPLNDAIDRCWSTSCATACPAGVTSGLAPEDAGDAGDADADAGDAGAPACGAVPVATPSDACNACTVVSCCGSWTACFADADCAELNACLQVCTNIAAP